MCRRPRTPSVLGHDRTKITETKIRNQIETKIIAVVGAAGATGGGLARAILADPVGRLRLPGDHADPRLNCRTGAGRPDVRYQDHRRAAARHLWRTGMTAVAQTIFDSTFAGELIGPDHPGYDTARQVFNGAIDKRPALIARCTSPADVRIALAHAREQRLVVAVRGGGHSVPGHSSCDGGLVIDTGPMKRIEIDVESRTGPVRGGPDVVRVRRSHAGARTGGHRRARLPHGHRRTHPRQRVWLARAGVRDDV